LAETFSALRAGTGGENFVKTLSFAAAILVVTSSLSFFKFERYLQPANSAGQHYVVVDETIWEHAQSDLADVRLYSADKEIPYALETERRSSESELQTVRVLQPATVAGKTQFLLDMSGVSEYDRIALNLAATNFVAHARIEGQDDPHGARWAVLGTTTLYDLSDEKLGHNSTLQIPESTYKYLRVTVDGPLKPADIQGASAGITESQQAVWRTVAINPTTSQKDKDTVITFTVPDNVPVERIVVDVDPAQSNFMRETEVSSDSGESVGTGEISRIHMQRAGNKIDVEQTSLEISGTGPLNLIAIIHNGDDPPLQITAVHLQQYERRIYFDSTGGATYRLYYGDDKLDAPVYDYAKLFQLDANASAISLIAEEANAAYTGRPDDRPWSERHPAVLWLAILAAVLTLGGIALKSVRSATPS
jgi:hypothetical protein